MPLCKGFLLTATQKHNKLQVRRSDHIQLSHLIPHVRQILKAHGRTEHLVVHVHDLVLVTAGVQVVHGALNQVQAFVARSLQVVLGREISPKCACQASMIAKVTALEKNRGQKENASKNWQSITAYTSSAVLYGNKLQAFPFHFCFNSKKLKWKIAWHYHQFVANSALQLHFFILCYIQTLNFG